MEEPFVFKVNLGGMIDILANHLYSSPDVFIRELLQNGTDAISGRQLHDPQFSEGRIDIYLSGGMAVRNPQTGELISTPADQLIFKDNGVGLTEEEIHRFLAVIGQSSKRDLQTGKILEDYIGRFGIGMLSCFMVTDEIELWTRSAKQPQQAYCFRGKPDGTYSITPAGEDVEIGTKICIKAKKGCEHYFNEVHVMDLVRYYGLPLPFPVMMHGRDNSSCRINEWHRTTGSGAHDSVMQLGQQIFESDFMDYIPLESKSGLFSGAAFIMPHAVSMHAKNSHRIYLKNMLLTEDGSAILPKWSFFLRCFLNTSQLRPTASRENFYEDEVLEQAREELNECISGYLLSLSRKNPQLLQRIIDVHFLAIKSMAAEDDVFFRTFMPFLDFETNMGRMSGRELMTRHEPISYTADMNQFHRTGALMLAQNQLLVNACYVHDTGLLRKLSEQHEELILYPLQLVSFEEFLEEPSTQTMTDAAAFLKTAKEIFQEHDCDVQLKSFSPASLPVFYMLDENAQIMRDIQHSKEHSHSLFASMLDSFAEEIEDYRAVLYVNCSNALIQKLIGLENPEKLRACLEILYVQALLTGRFPMRGGEMALLNSRLIRLIEWGLGDE
jgi:molecular chaperone HtpG